MKRYTMQRTVAHAALALALALAPAAARAVDVQYDVVSYVTKLEVKPVGDAEGHVAGTWERRGLCLYSTGEIATYHGAGTLDHTKGKGAAKGESTCTFEDGSSATVLWSAEMAPGPRGLTVFSAGKGEYTRGTGRFAGITGTITFAGRAYTPVKDETKGDVVMITQGTYSLPKS
jgi:hypothetical protein